MSAAGARLHRAGTVAVLLAAVTAVLLGARAAGRRAPPQDAQAEALRARGRHHGRHRPKTLGKALSAHHVNPAIIEQVLRRAHVTDVFSGPTLDGWDTSVDTGGGEGRSPSRPSARARP